MRSCKLECDLADTSNRSARRVFDSRGHGTITRIALIFLTVALRHSVCPPWLRTSRPALDRAVHPHRRMEVDMRHGTWILIVGLLLAPLGYGLVAGEAATIDQQQPIIDSTAGGLAIGGSSEQKLAQVVTAGVSGFLTGIRLPVSCGTGQLIVEIQGVDQDIPNGIVLTSES